jgi:hypothetical protein
MLIALGFQTQLGKVFMQRRNLFLVYLSLLNSNFEWFDAIDGFLSVDEIIRVDSGKTHNFWTG